MHYHSNFRHLTPDQAERVYAQKVSHISLSSSDRFRSITGVDLHSSTVAPQVFLMTSVSGSVRMRELRIVSDFHHYAKRMVD